MGLIRWIPGFLFALLVVFFAVSNRETINLHWFPFQPAISLPLYLVVLGIAAAGFIAGALVFWLGALPTRVQSHRQKKRINELEQEIEKLKAPPARFDNTAPEKTALPMLNIFKG